jgi:hypothetical protein
MASPTLRDDFAATVELYSTFIKQMKAENPQLNVSEVSFAQGKGSKNLFGKRGSSGISNVSNAAVDDRFFEKHEYHDLTPEQNNTLRLKRLKRFNDFDREVTVTGWDTEGETKSLRFFLAALGYTNPDTGKTVVLIIHQSIFSPTLSQNLLSTMQMRLHDVVVNETPKN